MMIYNFIALYLGHGCTMLPNSSDILVSGGSRYHSFNHAAVAAGIIHHAAVAAGIIHSITQRRQQVSFITQRWQQVSFITQPLTYSLSASLYDSMTQSFNITHFHRLTSESFVIEFYFKNWKWIQKFFLYIFYL